MQTLFITRNLETGSPIIDWGQRNGWTIIDQSLLRFEPVRFWLPKPCAWWFFYSPRAVEFAANKLALCAMPLPKLAAMGPGTANALQSHDYGLSASFVGNGSPEDVANDFGRFAAGERVFFPRARQSRKTVQTLLENIVEVHDAVCYNNLPVDDPAFVHAGVYVFTSPLNVRTYLSAHPLPADSRIIAIGPSTAQALASFGVRAEIAEESSERGIRVMLEQG
ncbi:MAG: uroporphyrinogen-III synthase [Bacteroidota bacterium]